MLGNGRSCAVRSCSREDAEEVLFLILDYSQRNGFYVNSPAEGVFSNAEEQQYPEELEKKKQSHYDGRSYRR